MARSIPLSQGLSAVVDDEDFERISQFRWHARRNGRSAARSIYYAVRSEGRHTIYMHRVVAGAAAGQVVDHGDHDGLNNCRSNLRLCDQSLNTAHGRTPRGRSGFRGVYPKRGRWEAKIELRGVVTRLGMFDRPEDGAAAYDAAAQAMFAEFAILNGGDA
jgi:hypothetical protein